MKQLEAQDLEKKLGRNHPWWYFEAKQLEDSPHWFVLAQNKINGGQRRFYSDVELPLKNDILGGDHVYTKNISTPIEACIYLTNIIKDLRYRIQELEEALTPGSKLGCDSPKVRRNLSGCTRAVIEEETKT